METTVVCGTRARLAAHLRNAADALERGDGQGGPGFYRLSAVTASGGASDLVFEVNPEFEYDPDRWTHLMVWTVDAGRPEKWEPGHTLRPRNRR